MGKKKETALVTREDMALANFDLTEAEIAKRLDFDEEAVARLNTEYMAIIVKDVNDKEGFDAAHNARMKVKDFRVQITKSAKEFRDKANKFSKLVIKVENHIVDMVTPIEEHLQTQEDIINNEKARLKGLEEAETAAKIQARIDRLEKIGCVSAAGYIGLSFDRDNAVPEAIAKTMPDEEFDQLYKEFECKVAAEKARVEQERVDREAEQKRLAKIREDQETESKRLETLAEEQRQREASIKAQQDALDAEKKRMADAKLQDRKERLYALGLSVIRNNFVLPYEPESPLTPISEASLLELPEEAFQQCLAKIRELNDAEAIRAKAADEQKRIAEEERIRQEEIARLQREADEKAEANRLEKEEEARIAELRPDKEKVVTYLTSICKHMSDNCPVIKNSGAVYGVLVDVEAIIQNAIDETITKLEELSCQKQSKKAKK